MLAGLCECSGLLAKFGGHKMAAGLVVHPGMVGAFREAFNRAAVAQLQDVDLSPRLHIDAVLDSAMLDWDFHESLSRLKPFGQDNPEPVWALRNARVVGTPRVVGQKHLKFAVEADGHPFEAIAFEYPLASLPSGPIDVAFRLKENHWNGESSLQLQVQDIRPSQ